jgi:23S rRNA G2445 N2-methylase RlmL
MSDKQVRYYAQTMPGIEEIAWLEIRSRLPQAKFVEYLFAKEQNGIVVFDYEGATADLLQLRTVEDVFLQALSVNKVSRNWQDIGLITDLVQKSEEFGRAVNNFLRYRKFPAPPTYRVISRKYGQHPYRRKDFAEAILKGMKARYPRWTPRADDTEVEVWANLLGSHLLCGLRLSDRTMRHRFAKKVELEASLRPSVAAAMVFLTNPEANDIFLEPMCGSGTLLLERRTGPYRQLLGGDILSDRAWAARQNLLERRQRSQVRPVSIYQWDARRLPLASGVIDKVATNLPFGKQIGSPQQVARLYPAFFAEVARVLRPNGRAVVLSSEYELVKESVRRQDNLEIVTGYSIAVLGQWGRIYIVERKA